MNNNIDRSPDPDHFARFRQVTTVTSGKPLVSDRQKTYVSHVGVSVGYMNYIVIKRTAGVRYFFWGGH